MPHRHRLPVLRPGLILTLAMIVPTAPSPAVEPPAPTPTSVLPFRVRDIDDQDVPLAQFQGKVLLIVNTASQCGYTPQYRGLEAVYQRYRSRGFVVLAFPSDDFGHQEPGENPEIKGFCTSQYQVSFPLFAKIRVRGDGAHPLYRFLTRKETNPGCGGPITWNFTKFLVDRKGRVLARFNPADEPESEQLLKALEAALDQ